MNTSTRLRRSFVRKIKKNYVANLLKISRPTLNRKIKDNDFKDWEIKLLMDENII